MNQQNSNVVSDFLLDYGVTNPSRTLIQAIVEGSNRAGDWLWYADQMDNDAERCYCFARVLYISPTNRAALDALKALNKKQQGVVQRNPSQSLFHAVAPVLNAFAHLLEG